MATILILDEQTDSCILLKRLLERNSHCVWAFVNRSEALECAARTKLDLALVSVPSRGAGGFAAATALKHVNTDLKVMIIGDYVSDESVEAMSADGFLVKPVDIATVEKKVQELLRHRPTDAGPDTEEEQTVAQ